MPSNELSERVCRKMGIEPEVYEGPHGKSHDRQHVYPDLLTPEWAGKLLVMLAARGVEYELVHASLHNLTPEAGNFGIRIWPKRIDYCADTLPEAICRAIDAMPEGL